MQEVSETKVNDSGSVAIPAAVREEAEIEAGDKLRWTVDEGGNLSVEVIRERFGAFDDFEPFETEEPVDGVEAKHTAGVE
ncbi:AbrB/MazE/SpoVT family DNA-binding domain-containing protein [Halobaculum sp. MBLA0147]|uniref:AbrB/MazE/SpoVT family DNA-binding domain-containing protein n=1 Tax=Halobaculum sp. MBLA0147 TaxID=3079934 RepID=UPI0035257A16